MFNSVVVVTQSIDEQKFISRRTKAEFTVYNSIAFNVEKGFGHRTDGVPQGVIDMIREQPGVKTSGISTGIPWMTETCRWIMALRSWS